MFLSNSELKRAWYEFQETLIYPPDNHLFPEQRYRFIQNTRRPQEYFNLSVIPALRVKPFIAPSTFVALGLLMTFIGLVAALTNAANAFTGDSSDGAAIESAINNLLIVAGAKFFASIGGLVSSLMVSVFAGWWQNRINKVTYQLCDDLEKRTWFVSQTQVASDQYAYAIRQTDRLEDLADQLAVSIGEQFKIALDDVPQQFAGAIGGQLTPVITAIDGIAQNLGDGLGKALAESAGSMSEELRKDTEETIRTMVAELKSASEGLGETTGQLHRLAEGFEESTSSLNGAAGQLYQATNSVRPLIDSMDKLQKDATATQDTFNQILERLQSDLESAKDAIQTNVTQSRETIESLESLWGAQAEQLKLTDEQLETAFAQVQRMTQESVAHLNEHLSKMDSSVANIGSYLHNANSELAEAVEGLDDSVIKLTKYSNRQ
jgi:ABC-type transporter Mla subunit MlaD